MCTQFTLHYDCGHTQASLRCPSSTSTAHGANGSTVQQVNGCDSKYYLEGKLPDDCMDCKMQRGLMPGVASGANAWAQWGAKEIALAERMNKVDHDFYEVDSPAGTAPHENWEDQVRAVLMDRVHDETSMPETSTTRSGSCLSERKQEVKVKKWEVEEDDDWMYGGLKDFGGTKHSETGISG